MNSWYMEDGCRLVKPPSSNMGVEERAVITPTSNGFQCRVTRGNEELASFLVKRRSSFSVLYAQHLAEAALGNDGFKFYYGVSPLNDSVYVVAHSSSIKANALLVSVGIRLPKLSRALPCEVRAMVINPSIKAPQSFWSGV